MLSECFGRFGEGDCLGCQLFELCSGYFVVEEVGRCPFFGRGFKGANDMCKLCVKYFNGEECKKMSGKRVRGGMKV
jgi:hypothetical protein